MKRVALLDADIFCYKVAQAAMKEMLFDEHIISVGDSAEAKVALDNWIDKVSNDIKADRIALAFTGPANFRKELWPEYKAHRVKQKIMLFTELREYCNKVYTTLMEETLEADDLIGRYVSQSYAKKTKDEIVGISEDKDMQSIPGAHFNPAKDTIIKRVDLQEATYNFYIQTLVGDPADNYKGCPGIGETKAHKYLMKLIEELKGDTEYFDYHDFVLKGWELIVKCFDKAGLDESDAVQNATMAKLTWYGEEPGWFHTDKLLNYWRLVNGK